MAASFSRPDYTNHGSSAFPVYAPFENFESMCEATDGSLVVLTDV